MFRDLKTNQTVYLLRKGEGLQMSEAKVQSVGLPRIDTAKVGNVNQMLVDVTISEGDKQTTYSIPESLNVTYSDNLAIMCDVDSLIREVTSVKRQSEAVLSSVERNRAIIVQADAILGEYSPDLKERKRTEERFEKMEESMAELKRMIQKLTTTNKTAS